MCNDDAIGWMALGILQGGNVQLFGGFFGVAKKYCWVLDK